MRVVWKWKQERDMLISLDSTYREMMVDLKALEVKYIRLNRNYDMEIRLQDAKDKYYTEREELYQERNRALEKTIRKQRTGMISGGALLVLLIILL